MAIASILKIGLGFDSKNLKLDNDIKNSKPRFGNCLKSIKNSVSDLNQLEA